MADKATTSSDCTAWLGEMKSRIQSARISAAQSVNRELILLLLCQITDRVLERFLPSVPCSSSSAAPGTSLANSGQPPAPRCASGGERGYQSRKRSQKPSSRCPIPSRPPSANGALSFFSLRGSDSVKHRFVLLILATLKKLYYPSKESKIK